MSKALVAATLAACIITQAMIDDAKAKYGDENVKIASLPLDDDATESLDVLVRVPDRKTLGEFEKWQGANPNKAKEIVINACVLSFKDVVKADDALFMTAFNACADLIPVRKATIKNC
jgi:hypothetical protein